MQPAEVQNLLKKLADERFSDDLSDSRADGKPKIKTRTNWQLQASLAQSFRPSVTSHSKNEDVLSTSVRRGGVDLGTHKEWLSTIAESPNVISMSFVPITSLLAGVQGCGFLNKPPVEELTEFLEFQLPRQWAPAYGDLPLGLRRKKDASPSLPYGLMGPKLYVNVAPIETGNRPVTGIRLFLEGKRSDRLAIHLQHLSALPNIIQLSDDHSCQHIDQPLEKDYMEPIRWSMFSHVYTAPVEYNLLSTDDAAPIVTKAWFEIKSIGMKKVLFLRLGFSMVASAKLRRSEWDEPTAFSRKSGIMSKISGRFSGGLNPVPQEQPNQEIINSALYPGGPPASAPKLSNIVDTKEMIRGPEDPPGYWVVTGAKLCMLGGKISIKAKFSLLMMIMTDSEDSMSM
ncbi:MACPF domain-containing protein NSL1 [Bienertia sinuspersici]